MVIIWCILFYSIDQNGRNRTLTQFCGILRGRNRIDQWFFYIYFLSSPKDMLIDFRERAREGDRGRQTLIGCLPTRDQSAAFQFAVQCSNQLRHSSQQGRALKFSRLEVLFKAIKRLLSLVPGVFDSVSLRRGVRVCKSKYFSGAIEAGGLQSYFGNQWSENFAFFKLKWAKIIPVQQI